MNDLNRKDLIEMLEANLSNVIDIEPTGDILFEAESFRRWHTWLALFDRTVMALSKLGVTRFEKDGREFDIQSLAKAIRMEGDVAC